MNTLSRQNGSRPTFSLARDLFGYDPFGFEWIAPRAAATFSPKVELVEKEDGYYVTADVPGIKESDIDISMHNGTLTITGSRISEQRKEGETVHVVERQFGKFSRSFELPDKADDEKVQANLKDGVLSVKIGKRETVKPRKIQITG